ITHTNPEQFSYTLNMSNSEVFNTFHVCQLKRWFPNNDTLYPQRQHKRPGPIVTPKGMEEYYVECITDERKCGHGMQYLVYFQGYGPEEDRWIARLELEDCEALD
ncbi:hypothetical protein CPB85DRAFT_1165012, partial [Mucidula mucida]